MDESDKVSTGAKVGMGGGGALAMIAAGVSIGSRNWNALLVLVAVLTSLLAVGVGILYFWQAHRRKK